jgi:ferredoxin
VSNRLVVDPVKCVGHGVCVELLPDWLSLDEWGYPVVPRRALPGRLAPQARQAVLACPALALHLL